MVNRQNNFSFDVYASVEELNEPDAALLTQARAVTAHAYAPYSHFNVGAAAILLNGQIVTGTNQENASYPVGICAERVLLSAVSSLYPGAGIQTMAISYFNSQGNSNNPVSPCGMCRQALAEYEEHTNQSIRLILSGMNGEVFIISRASELLPLSFTKKQLK
jgi:cytidine deaminase